MKCFLIVFLTLAAVWIHADDKGQTHFTGNLELSDEEWNLLATTEQQIKSIERGELFHSRLDRDRRLHPRSLTEMADNTSAFDLPTQADNSQLPAFPEIQSQGQVNSCNAFAIGYYQLTYTFGQKYGWNNDGGASPTVFSPKWIYNLTNNGVDGGTSLLNTYRLLENHGGVFWEDFPYDGRHAEWPVEAPVWRKALDYRIAGVGYIDDIDHDAGLSLLKEALTNGDVLTFNTYAYSWQYKEVLNNPESSDDDGAIGNLAIYLQNGSQGSHTICIVGYNDDIWVDINANGIMEQGEKGALKLANSWGKNWGNEGFVWLAYDALRDQSAVLDDQTVRVPAMVSGKAYSALLREFNKPRLIGEITLSHARRNQMKITLGMTTIESATPLVTWQPFILNNNGGAKPLNSSSAASEITIVLDFTNLAEEYATQFYQLYNWQVIVTDSNSGSPTNIKAFRLVDVEGGDIDVSSAEVPKTLDNETVLLSQAFMLHVGTVNYPPMVNAGKVQFLRPHKRQFKLTGRVFDDLLPVPSTLSNEWSKVVGPGEIEFRFGDRSSTIARVTKPGVYELALTANDTEVPVTDTTTVVLYDQTKMWAEGGQFNDELGSQVAISGQTAVVASVKDGVHIYKIGHDGKWKELQTLTNPFSGESEFGASVDVDQDRIIIGNTLAESQGKLIGAAHIYEKNENGFWFLKSDLYPSSMTEYTMFGCKVAISGKYAMVANIFSFEDLASNGVVHMYKENDDGQWEEIDQFVSEYTDPFGGDNFGSNLDIDGPTAVIACPAERSAYVYELVEPSGWQLVQKISSEDPDSTRNFAGNVAVSEGTIVISDDLATVLWTADPAGPGQTASSAGVIHVYEKRPDHQWARAQMLTDIEPRILGLFGRSVAIQRNTIAVGSINQFAVTTNGQASVARTPKVTVFSRQDSGLWEMNRVLEPIDRKVLTGYGQSLAVHNGNVLVGDPYAYGIEDEQAGSAYIYQICEADSFESAVVDPDDAFSF